jgi:hypothetical protein
MTLGADGKEGLEALKTLAKSSVRSGSHAHGWLAGRSQRSCSVDEEHGNSYRVI